MKRIYPAKIGYCSLAFSSAAILSNGEVTICCGDYDGRTSLGNLNDHPLIDLLTSDEADTIYEGFKKMGVLHPQCQHCMGATSHAKGLARILFTIGALKILGYGPGQPLKEVALFGE